MKKISGDIRSFFAKVMPPGNSADDANADNPTFSTNSPTSNVADNDNQNTSGASAMANQTEVCQGNVEVEAKSSDIHREDPIVNLPLDRIEREARLAEGPFQPVLNDFPRSHFGKSIRSFQEGWYKTYNWLEYSPAKDAAFCFCCRFFAMENALSKGHVDKCFTESGFKNWKRATEKFKCHQISQCHVHSFSVWKNYSKARSIDTLLDDSRVELLKKQDEQRLRNRDIMKRLIDITVCLAKGGRSFRGHNEKKYSSERGLFLELIILVSRYDPLLKAHLTEGPKNALYVSNKIQNDIILSIHNVIIQSIVSTLNGKHISLIADETSDCGHHEQMSIVIRFFDPSINKPIETFIGLQRLNSVNSESIFNALDNVLRSLKLKWEQVVSVCFDGASTMSGNISGVQSRCKQNNPDILYVHCYAHCLNLTLVDACCSHSNNKLIFDFFGIIQCVYSFLEGSCVRHAILEKIANSINMSLKTLKSLSTTRWACRSEAVSAVKDNYEILILALQEIIETTKQSDVKIKAVGLLAQLKSFNFLICLHMTAPILVMILKVSKALQTENLNLLSAINSVKSLQSSLQKLRLDSETFFNKMYVEVEKILDKHGITIPETRKRKIPRKIDQMCDNQHEFGNIKDFVRINTFYPFLDSLVSGIDQRFSQETTDILKSVNEVLSLNCEGDFTPIENKFKIKKEELLAELSLIKFDNSIPKGVNLDDWMAWILSSDNYKIYTSFFTLLKMFAVIPVTSCSCERSFSKMVQVKSKLRSTMSQQRLDSLLFLFIEQEKTANVNYDNVIDEFKVLSEATRRMRL